MLSPWMRPSRSGALQKSILKTKKCELCGSASVPRERGVMVQHPPRVLATLSDVSVKLVFQDGRTDERGAPAGVAAWLESETLQTENASAQALEVVLVEPKSALGF